MLNAVMRHRAEVLDGLSLACQRVGGRYMSVMVDRSLDWIIREKLRREGWFAA